MQIILYFQTQNLANPIRIINQGRLNQNFFHGNHKDSSRDTDTEWNTMLGVAVLLAPLQLEHQDTSIGQSPFFWLSRKTSEQIPSVFPEIMYNFWFVTWIPRQAVTRPQLAFLTPSKEVTEE